MIEAMALPKFRAVLTARYPVLLDDEYQDTDAAFVDAMKTWFLDHGEGPLIGLFGDHWQNIYGDGCGSVEHASLEVIANNANFLPLPPLVQRITRVRPDHPQPAPNPHAPGAPGVSP